jgi:hypothetical protein
MVIFLDEGSGQSFFHSWWRWRGGGAAPRIPPPNSVHVQKSKIQNGCCRQLQRGRSLTGGESYQSNVARQNPVGSYMGRKGGGRVSMEVLPDHMILVENPLNSIGRPESVSGWCSLMSLAAEIYKLAETYRLYFVLGSVWYIPL